METMTDTPETDQAERESIAAYIESYGPDAVFPCDGYDHARKLERERDEWQINALLKLAVKQLACMWCGELVHAPTGYEPGTPLNAEQRAQAYQQHVATCPAHPIRDVEREREEWKAKYIQQNKDLGCEMMDPSGTIWDYAKKLQAKRDELLAAIRNLRDVKGRFHTEQAAINLFNLLP